MRQHKEGWRCDRHFHKGGSSSDKGGGGGGGSGANFTGNETDAELAEKLQAAGVRPGLETKNDINELRKLDPNDLADREYASVMLTSRSQMANNGSALDRISDQRRLATKTRTLNDDDAISVGSNFSQGFYNTGTQASRTANLEYTLRAYQRLTPAQRTIAAQQVARNRDTFNSPLNSQESKNPAYRNLVNDLRSRLD